MTSQIEHDLVITFTTTRGSFTIPADILIAAEDGDDYELRRLFARSLPEHDPSVVLTTSRRVLKDGSAVVAWRRIETHLRRA